MRVNRKDKPTYPLPKGKGKSRLGKKYMIEKIRLKCFVNENSTYPLPPP